MNGILVIYKEAGYTSHDVVARLRGILKQKKIGHTGTLDPDAMGVLPVCLGNATKLCDMVAEGGKEYKARMLLGVTTDTQDMSGRVLSRSDIRVSRDEIETAVMSFVGGYEQVPPMFSALKIGGKRLYELARMGREVERAPRHVEISDIKILDINPPRVSFTVECSKGTYIRSLCADIGDMLGCGAAMQELTRLRVGQYKIADALTLSEVEELADKEMLEKHIIPIDSLFEDYYSATVREEAKKTLMNGNKLYPYQLDIDNENHHFIRGDLLRVYLDNPLGDRELKAVYCYDGGCFKPYKMFL